MSAYGMLEMPGYAVSGLHITVPQACYLISPYAASASFCGVPIDRGLSCAYSALSGVEFTLAGSLLVSFFVRWRYVV